MAVLPDTDRQKIWRGLMRYWSNSQETLSSITKTDLKAAVDATDTWIDNNQASFNSALPVAFRNNATTAQKTVLFCAVALMRVSSSLLQKVFGSVD